MTSDRAPSMADWPSVPDAGGEVCLFLGGFQVFKDVVAIPLAPMTFMLGPNSSGKSSVQDGLRVLNDLLSANIKRDFEVRFGEVFFNLLHDHWRQESGDREPYPYTDQLTIGMRFLASDSAPLQGLISDTSGERLQWLKQDRLMIEVILRYKYQDADHDYGLKACAEQDIFISLGNEPLLCLEVDKFIALNIDHPILRNIFPEEDLRALTNASFPCDFGSEEFKQNHRNNYLDMLIDIGGPLKATWVANGWLYVCLDPTIADGKLDRNQQSLRFFEIDESDRAWRPHDPRVILSGGIRNNEGKFSNAVSLFLDLTDLFLSFVFSPIDVANNPLRHTISVPASRNVPSKEDLVYLFDSGTVVTKAGSLDDFGFTALGKSNWCRDLAASLLPFDSAYYSSCNTDYIDTPRHGERLGQQVNRALSDHLFIDKGYRVAVDIRILLDEEQFCGSNMPALHHSVDYPVLAYMHLLDEAGRKLSFHNVGTGISYVLPVLCAAYRDSKQIQFIEQPELHIHPALQAALGDVFIEAKNSGRRLVVETHSEHILLRVLKRIRQSSSERLLVEELRLNPDDIAVLYFDPQRDGSTQVKKLRISPDGEFIDPWPKGFFEERFQELFDE